MIFHCILLTAQRPENMTLTMMTTNKIHRRMAHHGNAREAAPGSTVLVAGMTGIVACKNKMAACNAMITIQTNRLSKLPYVCGRKLRLYIYNLTAL